MDLSQQLPAPTDNASYDDKMAYAGQRAIQLQQQMKQQLGVSELTNEQIKQCTAQAMSEAHYDGSKDPSQTGQDVLALAGDTAQAQDLGDVGIVGMTELTAQAVPGVVADGATAVVDGAKSVVDGIGSGISSAYNGLKNLIIGDAIIGLVVVGVGLYVAYKFLHSDTGRAVAHTATKAAVTAAMA